MNYERIKVDIPKEESIKLEAVYKDDFELLIDNIQILKDKIIILNKNKKTV